VEPLFLKRQVFPSLGRPRGTGERRWSGRAPPCSLRYRRGVTRWQGEGHVVSSLYNSSGVLERTPGVPNDHGDSRAGAIDNRVSM
jgi:hypothetical protein